jgi:EpsI family protein
MSIKTRSLLLMLLMFAAALGVVALKHAQKPQPHQQIGLEQMIPKAFSNWHELENVVPVMPSPEQTELINTLYDETFARSYINDRQEMVMLSIAYGGDQSGLLKVHRPENCYTASGFQVKNLGKREIATPFGVIPVRFLMAEVNGRIEPISYWIRVGDSTVTGVWGQRVSQIVHSMVGEVPDGLIFRVSSIGSDEERAFELHQRFVVDLLEAISISDRAILAGGLLSTTPEVAH